MGRHPKDGSDLLALARAARAQLRRSESLGKSLDLRLKMKREAADNFTLDEDDRRDFAAITHALQHAGNSLARALEGNKKDLGSVSEDQLQAQFNAEIINSAQSMSDEDWNKMLEARAKART